MLRSQLVDQDSKASHHPCSKRWQRSGKQFSDKRIIVRLFPHSFSHKKYADISLSISNHLQQSWHFKITLPLCSLNTIYVLCTCKRPHELTHTNEPCDRYIAILNLDNLFDNDSIIYKNDFLQQQGPIYMHIKEYWWPFMNKIYFF